MFRLRFDEDEIHHWAALYDYDDIQIETIGSAVRQRGHYTLEEVLTIGRWRTPRSQPLIASNDPAMVRRITATALSTDNEELRMRMLTSLRGIAYPSASALLHFGTNSKYPMLDFRSLWSAGQDTLPTDYRLDYWLEYIDFCREIAERRQITMRTLDRSLWQYSRLHQHPKGKNQ